ncbi:hypothetical protein [Streptomyces sp. NPDC008139]|uniref:hypothetical protein n=1 Tax=Streptomyces sp. NPDC008139 TaxID=3364814 RepID=UPI0036E58ECC
MGQTNPETGMPRWEWDLRGAVDYYRRGLIDLDTVTAWIAPHICQHTTTNGEDAMPDEPAYVVSATHPDGTPYTDAMDTALHRQGGTSVTAYGDADRDRRTAAIEGAGLTAQVRPA